MGRYSRSLTTKQVQRIEINYLQKKGYLRQKRRAFVLSWNNESEILVQYSESEKETYLRLNYVLTNRDKERKEYDYKIQIEFIPSNLGKGRVPYLVCPVTQKRCRILYRAYGSPTWKSRESYNNKLFYPSQVSSKLSKMNDKFWQSHRNIEALYKNVRNQTHYNGKPTRRHLRYLKLRDEMFEAEELRWSAKYLPKAMRKYIDERGYFIP